MKVVGTIQEMQSACRALRLAGQSLGLVPTMGALHDGHLSLVRASKATCGVTAVSIFVNPTQFAPNEDLAKYPRTFETDCLALQAGEVDLVFAPTVAEMYPPGAVTWVEVAEVSDRLDGASRPGHFRGVATVVAKLFHIVSPTHAFFGQKDAAQLAVLRKMVRDLNFDLEIVGCPVVREADGLAMSSRNRFLQAEERQHALVISQALREAGRIVASGVTSADQLVEKMAAVMREQPKVRVDYIAVADPNTLEAISDVRQGGLLAIAAFAGSTRLIDNILIAGRTG
ncbi:Pantoate--beta-alanine ligase [Acidisarcina polymorpha]|uniref:Pantothenate synthetase n=1 Tax=Acidisarcina polymorpha TaxID=2211140 RepID=A0A2Z5FX57_9BACT|nr:pantoate--beta-alanine ligase [Acidisarcina polymorpha]AXC10965.1 Pantoate--beta-alanine ligase [Acidisarcina polymorpha]